MTPAVIPFVPEWLELLGGVVGAGGFGFVRGYRFAKPHTRKRKALR